MQKHPYKISRVQYLLCQWDHAFLFDLLKKRFESDGETNWENLVCISKRSSDIWLKRTTPFTSRLMSHTVNVKKSSLCSLNGIFGTSSHHCQPLNVLVPSFWYSPHRLSCTWDLKLAALLAKLPFWLDIVWTLTQRGEFCDHLTSLINKSSVAK